LPGLDPILMKSVRTHIYCYDDYRAFSDEVRKSLADTPGCQVMSFLEKEDLLMRIEKDKGRQFCKIAIIGLHENREHIEMVENLTIEIKKRDIATGLVLLGPPEKIDEIKKAIRFNIEAYIPKNANYILRITNTVKKFVTEHSIAILRRRRNYSLYTLLIVILISLLTFIIAGHNLR
jgi:hypothetical protein